MVTGLGAVTPLGLDVEETWGRLLAGEGGCGPVSAFASDGHPVRIACEASGFDPAQWLDVKAVRTQPASIATKHLRNSLYTFLRLVEISRSLDQQKIDALIAERDYEELDWLILNSLIGG